MNVGFAAVNGAESAPDAVRGFPAVVLRTSGVRRDLVDRNRLVAGVDRFANETNRTVAENGVDAARVIARSRRDAPVFAAAVRAGRGVRRENREEQRVVAVAVAPTVTVLPVAARLNVRAGNKRAFRTANRRAVDRFEAEGRPVARRGTEVRAENRDTALHFVNRGARADADFGREHRVRRAVGDRGVVQVDFVVVGADAAAFVPFPPHRDIAG